MRCTWKRRDARRAIAAYRAAHHPRSFWVNSNLARLLAQQESAGAPLLEAAVRGARRAASA
jgi:hypothetical protein